MPSWVFVLTLQDVVALTFFGLCAVGLGGLLLAGKMQNVYRRWRRSRS